MVTQCTPMQQLRYISSSRQSSFQRKAAAMCNVVVNFRQHDAPLMAATSGAKGDRPAAIRSALTNTGHWASTGKNSRAKVVFPAPLGPAMMMARREISIMRCSSNYHFSNNQKS